MTLLLPVLSAYSVTTPSMFAILPFALLRIYLNFKKTQASL